MRQKVLLVLSNPRLYWILCVAKAHTQQPVQKMLFYEFKRVQDVSQKHTNHHMEKTRKRQGTQGLRKVNGNAAKSP